GGPGVARRTCARRPRSGGPAGWAASRRPGPRPSRVWGRKPAHGRLTEPRRAHRRACRSVRREQTLPDRSSLALARPLLAKGPSPSQEAQAREMAALVSEAGAGLSEADRGGLLLRHAEDPPYEESACLL